MLAILNLRASQSNPQNGIVDVFFDLTDGWSVNFPIGAQKVHP
jgi:hypothetical protein